MSYQSVFAPALFAGRTVLVTGGGSGIGRCTAHELAALGAQVVLIGRTLAKLHDVAGEILAAGAPVVIFDASGEAPVPGAVTVAVKPAAGMAATFALLPAAQTLMVAFAAERVENAGTPVRSNKITRSE